MTRHLLPEVDRARWRRMWHAFLIRDQGELLASYAVAVRADPGRPRDRAAGRDLPRVRGPVIDSRDLLEPEGSTPLCVALGVGFGPGELSWPGRPAGHRRAWGPYWYETCGGRPASAVRTNPPPCRRPRGAGRQCRPFYEDWTPIVWWRPGPEAARTPSAGSEGGTVLQTFDERNRDLIVIVGGRYLPRTRRGSAVRLRVQGATRSGRACACIAARTFNSPSTWPGCGDRRRRSPSHHTLDERSSRSPATLRANRMTDDVHIRLTLTRGIRSPAAWTHG